MNEGIKNTNVMYNKIKDPLLFHNSKVFRYAYNTKYYIGFIFTHHFVHYWKLIVVLYLISYYVANNLSSQNIKKWCLSFVTLVGV